MIRRVSDGLDTVNRNGHLVFHVNIGSLQGWMRVGHIPRHFVRTVRVMIIVFNQIIAGCSPGTFVLLIVTAVTVHFTTPRSVLEHWLSR